MNFKANHNAFCPLIRPNSIVCYLAKIWILKQITTRPAALPTEAYCLLSCKDMNFKANHNPLVVVLVLVLIVCYLAKIWILKQITTGKAYNQRAKHCLLSCKDMNFKANHNQAKALLNILQIVCYLAKIWILKQITTRQQSGWLLTNCLLSCKDMNFKANHNILASVSFMIIIVCYLAKIWILKQITTWVMTIVYHLVLFVILQRYEF